MKNLDFTDSVTAAAQGDMAAFEFLYNQTYSYLHMTISKYLKKEEDIEDVLQNTYLKIYAELPHLKEPKAFRKWAGMIAANAALAEIRRQKALKNSNIDLLPPSKDAFEREDKIASVTAMDEIKAESYYTEFNPEAHLDAKETKQLIDDMLSNLPEMQRYCIILWQQQYSTKEIAAQLDLPLGTVKTNIFQAKKKIKANVLELEKQGTKLYGMAPLPFFLWVCGLFDSSYADTLPTWGNAALYKRIVGQIRRPVMSSGQTSPMSAQRKPDNAPVTHAASPKAKSAVKPGTAGARTGLHSIAVKTLLMITAIGVIGLGGIFVYQTIKTLRTQKEMESLPASSRELAEHLQLEYIGNQLYIEEDDIQAPTGCIEAYAYDLDEDGQKELITIENTDTDFDFIPTLNIYEYDTIWKVAASMPLVFSEKNWGWDTDNMYGRYVKLLIYEDALLLTENYTTAEDGITFTDNGKQTLLEYTEEQLSDSSVAYDFYDVYENGLELCSIETQYINNTIYDSFAVEHMDINSYYNEIYYNHGNWSNKQESYLINFIDYRNLKTYDFNTYSFRYPAYFDSYMSFGENVIEYDITTSTKICMTGRGSSVLFGFSNSKYRTAQDLSYYRSGGMVRGLYQDIDGMYKLVWENGSDFIYYENASLTNARKMLEQTVLNEDPKKDINTLNVNLLLLSDTNNIIPYHFHTDLEGTTYPTSEMADTEKNTQADLFP